MPMALDIRSPKFCEIPEPKMICFYVGNGAGSKPLQGYLDGHPELYMLPAYPLTYFYPHWGDWTNNDTGSQEWPEIIEALLYNHSSILDSREFSGHNGLTTLGKDQNETLVIDREEFQQILLNMLAGEPVSSRTFLLAIHYAYAICRREDIQLKKALLYHVHVPAYVNHHVANDFPDMLTIGMVRDPRANVYGRYNHSFAAVDFERLNTSDALIYSRRNYRVTAMLIYEGLEVLRGLPEENCVVVRTEDLHYRRDEVMQAIIKFIGISDDICLKQMTFGGLEWWGDNTYDMKPMNTFNPRVVSDQWKSTIGRVDWYVFEGLLCNYFDKYNYPREKYVSDNWLGRAILLLMILVPTAFEKAIFKAYFQPSNWARFWQAICEEGSPARPLKDYSRHAFYRHKWTNQGLNLDRPRWYVNAVKWNNGGQPGRSVYLFANIIRYAFNLIFIFYELVNRWAICARAFLRMLKRSEILPPHL
jgi:hypothetical protein